MLTYSPDKSEIRDGRDWAAFTLAGSRSLDWCACFCDQWRRQAGALGKWSTAGAPEVRIWHNIVYLDLTARMETNYAEGSVIEHYLPRLLAYVDLADRTMAEVRAKKDAAEARAKLEHEQRLNRLRSLK